MTVVRSATSGDAPAWLAMRRGLWPEQGGAGHAEEVARFCGGTARTPLEVLLAFDAVGRPVGFVELSIRTCAGACATDRVAYLEGWYVVPDTRRRGVGRALVAAAERWAVAQGCTEFGSDALIENDVSAAAYQALGFDQTAQIRCFRKELPHHTR